jgi:cell division protein FtsB
VNLRRFLTVLYLAVFAGVSFAAWQYFDNAQKEYRQMKTMEEKNRQRLDEAERELRREEVILQRLRTDPAYVEQQIRLRLGYAKPDDMIFKFEQ